MKKGREAVHAAAQLSYLQQPVAATHWYNAAETLLFQRATNLPAQALDLQTQATYFESNKRRMDYLQLREDGYLIGSGMVESAAKQFKSRCTGPGMRWSREGISRLLPVCAAVLAYTFDLFWPAVYSSPKY